MNSYYETYVSLETAQLLKQAGFDWKTFGYYNKLGFFHRAIPHYGETFAPTLTIAQKWLREIYHTLVDVVMLVDKIVYGYRLQVFTDKSMQEIDYQLGYDTYEEALEAGIKKCLETILENK